MPNTAGAPAPVNAPADAGRNWPLALLFTVSVLLSSALLFLVEPMIARALLPEYGGSPSVWNTCVVGFQCLLLAGYAWAHWNARITRARRQLFVHLLFLAVSLAVLPYSLPQAKQSLSSPTLSVLLSLAATIALPFALLSSNSALAQRWFARACGHDPYPLYAASNVGSLTALAGYPLVFEPIFGLTAGWEIWAAGYVGFAALTVICIGLAFRTRRGDDARPGLPQAATPADRSVRAGWLLRSAVGSSLLLSGTMKMTTDIGSAPLLWVLPLSLYLLTFVIAFSPRITIPRGPVAVLTAIGTAWSLAVLIYTFAMPVWLSVTGLMLTVFFGCLLCHLDLASSKPDPQNLTQFYFWIAVGGAVGGVLNSLIAPLLFDSVVEFPITLILLAGLIHAEGGYLKKFPRERMVQPSTYLPLIFAAIALVVSAVAMAMLRDGAMDAGPAVIVLRLIPLALIAQGLLLARHAGQLEGVVSMLTLFAFLNAFGSTTLLDQRRSFFGTLRVMETPQERLVVHGTTVHGAQRKEPALSGIPTRYYHPAGPFGDEVLRERPASEVVIVGLGAGSLAAMGRPGDRITFLEIDPLVEEMAREHFDFMRRARARTEVQIGDGRLLLRRMPDRSMDVLIVDAFSSDAIPTHLLTREALALYLRKVRPGGIVLLHISNQHLDLTRVFRGWSSAEGRRVAVLGYRPTQGEAAQGAAPTLAIAIAPRQATLEAMIARGRWRWLGPGRSVTWTDDRSNLLGAVGTIRF